MDLVPALSMVADPVKQATYVQQLARRLRLDRAGEETVLRALRRSRGRPAASETPREQGGPRDSREEFCLALLMRYPSLSERGRALTAEVFSLVENREVFRAWREAIMERERGSARTGQGKEGEIANHDSAPDGDLAASVRSGLPEELPPHLDRVLSRPAPPYSLAEAEKALDYCVRGIERRKLELRKQASSLALADIEERLGAARLAEQAMATLDGAPVGSSEDEPVSEGVTLLVEDVEMGRRLHRHWLESVRQEENAGPPSGDRVEEDRQAP
jgi:hypothetical protein